MTFFQTPHSHFLSQFLLSVAISFTLIFLLDPKGQDLYQSLSCPMHRAESQRRAGGSSSKVSFLLFSFQYDVPALCVCSRRHLSSSYFWMTDWLLAYLLTPSHLWISATETPPHLSSETAHPSPQRHLHPSPQRQPPPLPSEAPLPLAFLNAKQPQCVS